MRKGVTLIEVVIVLVLVLIAGGLGAVFILHHRENALRLQCTHHLKQIGEAFQGYRAASSGALPPSRVDEGYATWAVMLAPHLAQEHPLHQWNFELSYFAQSEEARQARMIVFFCPSRKRTDTLSESGDVDQAGVHFPGALADYACVAGDGETDWMSAAANGAVVPAEVLKRDGDRILKWQSRTDWSLLVRGEAYTMLAGEKHVPMGHLGMAEFGDGAFYNGKNPGSFARLAGPGFPLAPTVDAPYAKNFGSYHNGICNFLMADTSVRPLATNVSEEVLGELARRGD